MKKVICIKELFLEKYDEYGEILEGELIIVKEGEIFELKDIVYLSEVRLESYEFWIEICKDTLREHFEYVK